MSAHVREPVARSTERAIFARDGLCCRYCGYKHHLAEKFHIDHVVSVANGGPSRHSNLVVACQQCNYLKGTATWTPMSIESAHSLRYPIDPFAVLRSQGFTPAEAQGRLAFRRRMRKVPKETKAIIFSRRAGRD